VSDVIPGGINLCHRPLAAADYSDASCGTPPAGVADI
jgi:hypothetical protein